MSTIIKALLLILFLQTYFVFSQEYQDKVYLKSGDIIKCNIINPNFRSIQVESEITNFILLHVIDSILTNKYEFIDSLKSKYPTLVVEDRGFNSLIEVQNLSLEKSGTKESPIFKRSLNVFYSFNYYDKLGFQLELFPSFQQSLTIRTEHSIGFFSGIDPYYNINLQIGLGKYYNYDQRTEVSIFLNYGIIMSYCPSASIDYIAFTGSGSYYILENKPYYLKIEYKLYFSSHKYFNPQNYKNIRFGFGMNLD